LLGRLVSSSDIDSALADVETNFLSTTNNPVWIAAGATSRLDISVSTGAPSFRLTRIRPATGEPSQFTAVNAATILRLGDRNVTVGVYSPDLTSDGASLGITGDGITVGLPTFTANVFPDSKPKLNLLSLSVSVATNATPGLRSFVVRHGTNIAYANGCLEILPAVPDFNFDGLDDAFQRRYFARFTSIEASPGFDGDRDGLKNSDEYMAGSDPTNGRSVLKLERVTLSSAGTQIFWQSKPGKRYQIFRRAQFERTAWERVGPALMASSELAEFLDSTATNRVGFYRVQVLP
jgi:hypothetical protein